MFVDRVRKNFTTMNKLDAIDEAVEYIVKLNGELSYFFAKNRSEVRDMCITEYNEAQHLENVKQEGIEQGQMIILDVQDYIIANPTASDSDVATVLNCSEVIVEKARKRIIAQ